MNLFQNNYPITSLNFMDDFPVSQSSFSKVSPARIPKLPRKPPSVENQHGVYENGVVDFARKTMTGCVHDVYMMCTWCVHDVYMMCTWCVHDVYMMCTCCFVAWWLYKHVLLHIYIIIHTYIYTFVFLRIYFYIYIYTSLFTYIHIYI